MFRNLLKKIIEPIVIEILKEQRLIKKRYKPTLYDGYDAMKHLYVKDGNGYINIVTHRLISKEDYEQIKWD